ncbi:MAG: DUF2769 domain-containing protein [Candidatus Helarchaeota archaeon]
MDEMFKNATFEEKMQMMENTMTEKQKRDSRENVIYICRDYCGKCPSNPGTGGEFRAYCMLGKCSATVEPKGCLCGQCPVTKMMSLRWEYYCTFGSAQELSQAGK